MVGKGYRACQEQTNKDNVIQQNVENTLEEIRQKEGSAMRYDSNE